MVLMKNAGKRRYWSAAAALILCIALAVVSAGCVQKVTAVSIAKQTADNLEKVKSLTAKENLKMGMKLASGDNSMDLSIDMDMDMKLVKEPLTGSVDMKAKLEGMGTSTEVGALTYLEKDGENVVTYTSVEGGEYTKQITPAGDFKGVELTDMSVLRKIADVSQTAELRKETEDVNGTEAYVIDLTLSGETLQEMLDGSMSGLQGAGLDVKVTDLKDCEVPTVLYISKEKKLPVRITMDLTSLGDKLTGQISETIGTAGLELSVTEMTSIMDFMDYDAFDSIEIPAEARAAKEVEL